MSTPTPLPTPLRLTQSTALLLTPLSAGLSASFSFFLVPRLLESPTPLMLQQWLRSYAAGARAMAPTALVTAIAWFYLGIKSPATPMLTGGGLGGKWGRGGWFLAAGALTVGIVPYTLAVMMGTNRRLKAKADEFGAMGKGEEVSVREVDEAKALVDWWGVLNLGRTVMLVAGSVCGLVASL